MFHLLYDHDDTYRPFMIVEDSLSNSHLLAYNWFSLATINKALLDPCRLATSLSKYLDGTPWEILTSFPSEPTIGELTAYIYSRPELLI